MDTKKKNQDEFPKEEVERRRDELAKRILRTPPEPRKPLDKSKNKPTAKRKPAK